MSFLNLSTFRNCSGFIQLLFLTRTQQEGASLVAVSFLPLPCFLQFSSFGASLLSLIKRPEGTEALPKGMVSKNFDLLMQPFMRSLIQKGVNKIVKKFPSSHFVVVLFFIKRSCKRVEGLGMEWWGYTCVCYESN
ncbi:uncharacterized protein LOC103949551 isoform X4 [Pyrus x bretschneideri]|uniref:uncharacterized protein LOC103949551 isoform X4 n=1 Tax=Pyrus x bretschneideri TaxID=225117 RepID=UPI00202E0A28|nr:uncharacterized protein LOC103949551 isoform X4 [Pyrus x bretschneideri]